MKAMSMISGEQFDRYLRESEQIVETVQATSMQRGFNLFSAALAGASLVRAINETMGGDINWWIQFISCSDVRAFIEGIEVNVGGLPNLPRGRGVT